MDMNDAAPVSTSNFARAASAVINAGRAAAAARRSGQHVLEAKLAPEAGGIVFYGSSRHHCIDLLFGHEPQSRREIWPHAAQQRRLFAKCFVQQHGVLAI